MTLYLILAAVVVIYALVAARLEYFHVTGPIVFVVIGFLLGSGGLSLVEWLPGTQVVRLVASLTLALLLFSDATTLPPRAVDRDAGPISRLLLIALPLVIAAGTGLGWLILPVAGLGMAALIASILAPTDLSLGMAMFGNPRVPTRVSRAINVESGLNDGVAAPLVALFIGLTAAEFEQGSRPLLEALSEIAVGVGIGVVAGLVGGWAVRFSDKAGWSSTASRQFATLALALLAYGGAVVLHGNGFLAAFVGGLAFGVTAGRGAHEAVEYSEKVGTLLTFVVWFIFGIAVAPIIFSEGLSWRPIVYALLSLTLIRMVPVALALIGKKLHPATLLFVGWFGPRGLASVVFLILAIEKLTEAGEETTLLAVTVGWTVLLSVILHGVSAGPVAAWYSSRAAKFAPGSPELEPPSGEIPARRSFAAPTSLRPQ